MSDADQIAQDATKLIESGELTAQNISRVATLSQNPEALAQAIINVENDIAEIKQLVADMQSLVSPELQQKFNNFLAWGEQALGFRHTSE